MLQMQQNKPQQTQPCTCKIIALLVNDYVATFTNIHSSGFTKFSTRFSTVAE